MSVAIINDANLDLLTCSLNYKVTKIAYKWVLCDMPFISILYKNMYIYTSTSQEDHWIMAF